VVSAMTMELARIVESVTRLHLGERGAKPAFD
jgi:hypothetical protein